MNVDYFPSVYLSLATTVRRFTARRLNPRPKSAIHPRQDEIRQQYAVSLTFLTSETLIAFTIHRTLRLSLHLGPGKKLFL
jgi:hypothetical protein